MKIFGWIVAIPFILLIVWGIGRLLFCGPDEGIRKVTYPLAQSILEYINEKGKPKSLLNIGLLPYKMEKCKKYKKVRESAIDISEKESCVFKYDEKQYAITIINTTSNTGRYVFSLYISDYKENTQVQYFFSQKILNSSDKTLKIRSSYVRSIRKPFLCKNGYLRMN